MYGLFFVWLTLYYMRKNYKWLMAEEAKVKEDLKYGDPSDVIELKDKPWKEF